MSHAYSSNPNNIVLSDEKKRKTYDRYGTVNDDDWDFDDFMRNFNFEGIFDIFNEEFFEDKLGRGLENRHLLRWMYTVKPEPKSTYRSEYKFNEIPRNVHGHGAGAKPLSEIKLLRPDSEWEVDRESRLT